MCKGLDPIKAFSKLGKYEELPDECLKEMVILFFLRTEEVQKVKGMSMNYKIYYQRSGKSGINMLPPCLNVLRQHVQRMNYQSRIWHQCFVSSPSIETPDGNYWCVNDDKLDF